MDDVRTGGDRARLRTSLTAPVVTPHGLDVESRTQRQRVVRSLRVARVAASGVDAQRSHPRSRPRCDSAARARDTGPSRGNVHRSDVPVRRRHCCPGRRSRAADRDTCPVPSSSCRSRFPPTRDTPVLWRARPFSALSRPFPPPLAMTGGELRSTEPAHKARCRCPVRAGDERPRSCRVLRPLWFLARLRATFVPPCLIYRRIRTS